MSECSAFDAKNWTLPHSVYSTVSLNGQVRLLGNKHGFIFYVKTKVIRGVGGCASGLKKSEAGRVAKNATPKAISPIS